MLYTILGSLVFSESAARKALNVHRACAKYKQIFGEAKKKNAAYMRRCNLSGQNDSPKQPKSMAWRLFNELNFFSSPNFKTKLAPEFFIDSAVDAVGSEIDLTGTKQRRATAVPVPLPKSVFDDDDSSSSDNDGIGKSASQLKALYDSPIFKADDELGGDENYESDDSDINDAAADKVQRHHQKIARKTMEKSAKFSKTAYRGKGKKKKMTRKERQNEKLISSIQKGNDDIKEQGTNLTLVLANMLQRSQVSANVAVNGDQDAPGSGANSIKMQIYRDYAAKEKDPAKLAKFAREELKLW